VADSQFRGEALAAFRAIRAAVTLSLSACVVLVAGALLAGAASPSTQPAPLPAGDLQTEHYDLHVEGLDAKDTGAMLEQLHDRLKDYFATEPKERLAVSVYATRERWAAALQADRQFVPPAAGGYYAPYTRKAYLWLQPSAYTTRQLILHEATHQFHFLVATGNIIPSALWYTEGLAEYFGMHNWDGKHLVTGVVPAVTLEDYPAAALKALDNAGANIEQMLPNASRPESWALVHFLLNRYPSQFRKLAGMLDHQQDAATAWEQAFGASPVKLSAEFHRWIVDHAQPWKVVWIPWQQRGGVIVGESDTTNALTLLKDTPKTLAVELETAGMLAGKAGLVFAYRAAEDFSLLQVVPGNQVRIIRRENGAWSSVVSKALPPAGGPSTLTATQDGESTTLWVNGQKIAQLPQTGQVGLNADSCRAVFKIMQPSGL
jgi:hypothetical protein